MLVPRGRLVFLFPVEQAVWFDAQRSERALPAHPKLRTLFVAPQMMVQGMARLIITMERVDEEDSASV